LTGYELSIAREHAVRPDTPDLNPLKRLASQARMTIVAGAPVWNDREELNIAALVILPDGSVLTHTKEHVHESEQHVFTSGPGGPSIRVRDTDVALAICADASHPQHASKAAAQGARVYAAGVMVTDDAYARKTALLERYASEHRMAVLLANYSGVTGGEVSAGRSAVWSEEGRQVVASSGTEESLVIASKDDGSWSGVVLPALGRSLASRARGTS
jgi:predicted amidohydrolase